MTREHAKELDAQDPLRKFRDEFLIPSKSDLKLKSLPATGPNVEEITSDRCLYFCGNSLGVQPRRTSQRIQQYLRTWATQGVFGHFKSLADSPLSTWLGQDEAAAEAMAPIVGAKKEEVAVMGTLTANLHFLMCAFYKPVKEGRHKIILENKAFPSDHFAVESQIRLHGLDPASSMITIEADKSAADYPLLSTEYILSVIDKHANDTAVLLLPGIQFYTGQLFDIKTITAHAQSKGIFVICDLAHAAGNVPLQLHDWNVDAAAWCTYKYLNSGPGGMGSLFVHERNSYVHPATVDSGKLDFPNRLSGWWGNEKSGRFDMHNNFIPIRGAGGFQVSNPSAVDMTSVCASLELFNMTDMATIREKSLKITKYLEDLLVDMPEYKDGKLFSIITPRDPAQRGAQLSLLLQPGLLAVVMHELEERSVVLDERKPDVIRVAPAPLYNSYEDVWLFIQAFQEALKIAVEARDGGKKVEGTDELKQTT